MKMNSSTLRTMLGLLAVAVLGHAGPGVLNAQQADTKESQNVSNRKDDSRSARKSRVRFSPPSSDAPSARLTGGSRGIGDKNVRLDVLW